MKVTSRDEAIASGSKYYFTGKPCKRNHICYRNVVGRTCVECKKLSDKESVEKRRNKKCTIVPPFTGKTISRKEAVDAGYKYYFTGKACANGHMAFRGVVNSVCVHCLATFERTDEAKIRKHEKQNKWNNNNTKRVSEIKSNWRKANPSKVKRAYAAYYRNNIEKIKAYNKLYEIKNRNKTNRRHRERYAKDPAYKASRIIRSILRNQILRVGGKKDRRTNDILMYSSIELKERLEFQFKEGMSWENYGEWHIDHKKPVSRFIEQGITDPAIINALSNLQPLWAKDNLTKSNKWIY